ncbi:MAG: peptidylprolyl isomerase [Flavobacteriales bacterium]|nr:peptidylprolyl isomerase [Flavobacteriales bacterium]
MAVIGKIRERGNLLVILVGGALLLFVLDALLSGNQGGRGPGGEAIGEIAGEEVSRIDFANRVDEQANLYRENGTNVDNQMQEQIRNSVWQEILRERTLSVQAAKAGLGTTLSSEEYDDIRWGENIVSDFQNNENFKGPDGKLDKALLKRYFANVQEKLPVLYEYQKKTFIPNRIIAKYNALLKKSCFVNSAQVKDDYAATNTKATFNFVARRYDVEPDSLYAVNDDDVRSYFNAHRSEKKWQQKAARSFVYVKFPATPTQEDIAATRDELANLRPEFETLRGKADSLFVLRNSTTKSGAATAYAEGTADQLNDSLILHADTGAVVGPFKDGDFWKMVKVKELADVPEARVRHILFSTSGKDPEAEKTIKNRADSVLAAVKRDKSKFEAMVEKYTEDPGSKSTGGVYEWFDKTRMVPEFTKASFDEKVGATTICKTSYGYHIVEVLGQRNRQERRVLTVDRKVRPDQALKEAWKTASSFALNNPDTASFRKSAAEANLAYTPVDEFKSDQRFVSGLQDPGSVISYVNRSKIGDKPSEPLMSEESYVVALLTGIREEGDPRFEDVEEAMTTEVRKQKKAEALLAKMAGKADLNALATELGISVQSASDMAFSGMSIPGGFNDPEVVGRVFTLANGQLSTPMKGDMAVYVASMTNLVAAGEMPENPDAAKPLTDKIRGRAEYQAFNAMKEAANIKDDRSKFF